MAVDITMMVVHKGEVIKRRLYDGRNSEWFDNLTGRSYCKREYEVLCNMVSYDYNWDIEINDKEILKQYVEDVPCYYYDHRRVSVGDYREWYAKTRPYLCGGWVEKYDAWLLKEKGITPNEWDVPHYLCCIEEENRAGYEFVTWEDLGCPDTIVINAIADCPADADIIFCFDC